MTNQSQKPPVTFWVISVLALLWNLMGVKAYLDQAFMSDETLAAMDAAAQELLSQTPAWATAAFAFAVWGGALASLLLVLRKKLAHTLFMVSLAGIVVQMFYVFFMSNSMDVYGPGGYTMPVMILGFGVGLVFYSKKAKEHAWIS